MNMTIFDIGKKQDEHELEQNLLIKTIIGAIICLII